MRLNNKKAKITALALVVGLLTSCAAPETIEDTEIPFLPTSSFPSGLNTQPSEITNDVNQLKKSFDSYRLKEGPGGEIDYYLYWGDTQYNGAGEQSEESMKANRERDRVSLAFYAPDIDVLVDGRANIKFFLKFDPHGKNILTLCNGMLFEVAGEAIKVPTGMLETCDLEEADDQSRMYFTATDDKTHDAEIKRLFTLLSQNTFVIRLMDTDHKEYVFTFDKNRDYPSPQAFFKTALEAEKAISLGLGY